MLGMPGWLGIKHLYLGLEKSVLGGIFLVKKYAFLYFGKSIGCFYNLFPTKCTILGGGIKCCPKLEGGGKGWSEINELLKRFQIKLNKLLILVESNKYIKLGYISPNLWLRSFSWSDVYFCVRVELLKWKVMPMNKAEDDAFN